MEIIIKQYDTIVTIKRDYDDLNLEEVFDMINAALIGVSWQQSQIESHIIEWAEKIKSNEK